MPKILRVVSILSVLSLLIFGYQNCGKMSAVDGSGPTSNSPQGVVANAVDFMSMRDGETYTLHQDVNLGGQVISRTFTGVKLIGNGHSVTGILAQCRQPHDCKVNSGRDFYISALSFEGSEISDINFEISADVSKFPTDNDDITAVNFTRFDSSKIARVNIVARISGTHSYQTGDNRFFVSVLGSASSTMEDVSVKLSGNVVLNASMVVGTETVGENWGSTLTRVTAESEVTWRPMVAGTSFTAEAIGSLNQGTVQESSIHDKLIVQANGLTFKSLVSGAPYASGKILNTQILTETNFTPDKVELLQNQNYNGFTVDKTGSFHTHQLIND